MSNIALHSLLKNVVFGLFFFALLPGCTKKLDPLTLGKPAFPELSQESAAIEEIRISTKIPSTSAWRVRLVRKKDESVSPASTYWELAERSDGPGIPDRADSAFVDHFLTNLATLTAEDQAGNGNDSAFGMTPYRIEVRLRSSQKERTLLFGDPTPPSGIFFKRSTSTTPGAEAKPESVTWIGRGALVTLFGNLRTSDIFTWRMPYVGEFEDVVGLELEKAAGEKPIRWSYARSGNGGEWNSVSTTGKSKDASPVNSEAALLIERLLRQRWSAIASSDSLPNPFPTTPDWKLRVQVSGRTPQTLEIFYVLDTIYARNPARTSETLVLYPEFAGTLRAFTQLRSTPLKSGIK